MRSTRTRLLAEARFPPPGTAVSCAVSGGADSLALLVLAVDAGCAVTAFHVDHALRPGSADEAGVVKEAAARFGAEFVSLSAPVDPGPNLEARARAARYSALPDGALTGHTADDQAETVLLNLMRGAGLTGLSGMRDDGRRPLLAIRRADTTLLCDELGLRPVQDPTNHDLTIRRNRVRHQLVPLLDAIAERDTVAVIARQAEQLADDDALLDALAGAVDPSDAKALAAAPVALARRAIRAWLRSTPGGHPPDAAAVDRVLAVARGEVVACEVAGVGRVSRSGGRLRLQRL